MRKCPSCGRSYQTEIAENRPLDLFSNCPHCPRTKRKILIFTIIVLIVVWILFWQYGQRNISAFFSTIGLSLDAIGAYLLATGYFEDLVIAGVIWDGHKPVEEKMPKHTWRVRYGVLLLVFGFILQAFGITFK